MFGKATVIFFFQLHTGVKTLLLILSLKYFQCFFLESVHVDLVEVLISSFEFHAHLLGGEEKNKHLSINIACRMLA